MWRALRAVGRPRAAQWAAMSTITVRLPALSPTMTEGVISKWLVKEGDEISQGDVMFEMETDKATMEVECPEDGVVAKIMVPAGTAKTAVNSVVALMVEPGEDVSSVEIPADTGAPAAAAAAAPAAEPSAAAPTPAPTAAPVAAEHHHGAAAATTKPLLPSVIQLVKQHSLNVSEIPATGPKGHLLKGDVLEFLATGVKASAAGAAPAEAVATGAQAAAAAAAAAGADADFVDIPLTNMRKIIAQRLTESKQTVPHTYATAECCIDNISSLRKKWAEMGHKVSVNDFIVRAAAQALRDVPEVNSQLQADGSIKRLDTVDISVAVATPTGLITPIVPNADQKGVVSISSTIKELAGRAKEGKLKPHEYQGGSFSISNLGMFGISEFSAVINPPQAAIMAVGGGREIAVPVEAAANDVFGPDYDIVTVMTVKVSFDQRVVDDESMAKWLGQFKAYIEDPSLLI